MSAETTALKAVRTFLLSQNDPTASPGLLLSGPPGVGKTRAVHLAAAEQNLIVRTVSPGVHVLNRLKEAFQSDPCHPHLVFLDELDALCHTRPGTAMPTRTTALLISLMDPPPIPDPWKLRKKVIVIAATNRINSIDSALRRPRRFEKEIVLSPPDGTERFDVLCALEPNVDRPLLNRIAQRATGFVSADLVAMCHRARQLEKEENKTIENTLIQALDETTPSVLREEFAAERPTTSWDDIGGLEDVKQRLKMATEWPFIHKNTFQRLGLRAPRGILLHGPPGVAKTTLVRAAAAQSRVAFLRLSGADVYSCYVGEAERILREAFSRARAASPCILFLDEIEAVVGKRGGGEDGVQERVLSTLLTEMDGVAGGGGVLVIGATNRVDLIDGALLRPGRFDDIIEVGGVDGGVVLKAMMRNVKLGKDVDLEELGKRVKGWEGGEVRVACVEAGVRAVREWWDGGRVGAPEVCRRHFEV